MDDRMSKWAFFIQKRIYKELVWPETCTHAIGNEWVCMYIFTQCVDEQSHTRVRQQILYLWD